MKKSACKFLMLLITLAQGICAEEASTLPEGCVTVTIAASADGITYNQTPLSAPLFPATSITGQSIGKITAISSNIISNSSAGWTSGALVQAGSPYFVEIQTGAAAGRMFQITANTATTLTVNAQGLDLTTLGIVVTSGSEDSYRIVPGDTLLGILGTPANGVVGGTSAGLSANTVDKVLVNDPSNNTAFSYYYDTSVSQWRRSGSSTNQGNLVISPKMGLIYSRIGTTPMTMSFLGRVPAKNSIQQVALLGTSIISTYYPKDVTLLEMGFHSMAGWRKNGDSGVTTANCDRVVVKVGSTFFSYYYDVALAQWRRVGSSTNQNSVVISAGSSVRLLRSGTAGQSDTWSRTVPYSL